ncbi:MAG: DUF3034 family protein [Candidatus Brocadiia bacterium]
MRGALSVAICVGLLAGGAALGAEPVPEEPQAPPPLPLHSIEGFSGVYLTETAYFANEPVGEGWFGLPSLSVSGTRIEHKYHLGSAVTMNFLRRVELGYSFQRLTLGQWDDDVESATGLSISDDDLRLHTTGLRFKILRDGEWDTTWAPALTAGVRYKKNTEIDDIDDDLLGTVGTLGYDDDEGVDFTLVASKTFADVIPGHPFILSAGARATEAIHAGFAGFGDDYHVVFEGNAIVFLTSRLALAGEYRQMPHSLDRLGELVKREDDWWSVALAYVFNEHLTATAGFANVGRVLDADEDFAWLAQLKWEF